MLNKQAFNPFLPGNEYIPDGEPRIFGDRVYVYGSHDKFNGFIFCLNDYICYSAPVSDLSDWRSEGVIYRKRQDPKNRSGLRLLFAPDVVEAGDGKYYLYYGLDFLGLMGVAVSDSPVGEFQFLGHIKYSDGNIWGRKKGDHFPFDPGVLVDDDGKIYLYSGFSENIPSFFTGFKKLKNSGGVVLELEKDMVTIKNGPHIIFPRFGRGSFPGHEFYEASSIRKINGKYYFVYSSKHNHELCYAVSESPMDGFEFGGTLVSLGDLFINGIEKERNGVNYLGNTHGGLLNLNNRWFIFYHRQTNRHSYSRQACAEEIVFNIDGSFKQSEVTSCGLNCGPLMGKGVYESRIACNLWSKNGVGRYDSIFPGIRFFKHPYFTQSSGEGDSNAYQYIKNMSNGAVAGFKYFDIKYLKYIGIKIRGKAKGRIFVSTDSEFNKIIAQFSLDLNSNREWINIKAKTVVLIGITPIYFKFIGIGKIDFYSLELL